MKVQWHRCETKSPSEDTKTQDYVTTDGPARSGAECEMTSFRNRPVCIRISIYCFFLHWVMFKEGFGREEDTAEFPATKPAQLNLTGMFRGLCWIINAWYHITSHASSQRHLWIFSCLTGEETTPEMREGLTHLLWGLKWAMQCPGTALCSPGTPSDSATFPWEDRGAATCKPSWAA